VVEVGVLEEVAEIFASLRDVDAALVRVLALARKISGNTFGAIYLRDEPRQVFLRWIEGPDTPVLHLPLALVESFFAGVDHRMVDLDDPRFDGIPAVLRSREGGVHGALPLPLRHDGTLVGVLGLGFPSGEPIPEAAVRTLIAVARFPAAAIVLARTQEVGDRRARLADALRRFGERALGTLGVAGLHQLILDTTVELTGSDQASITEVVGGSVRVVAAVGKDVRFVGTEAPVDAVSEALSCDGPYVVPDVAAADGSKLLVKLARANGAGSFMVLSMRHQDRVFGHVFAGAAEAHRYRAEEVEAMRILASMAAAVLEQRHAQAAAAHEAGRLAAAIEHLPIFIEVFDGTGAFVLGNRYARRTRQRLGVGPGTAARPCAGLSVTQLDGTAVSSEELPPAQALRGVHPRRCELVLLRDGQRLGTIMMAAAPIFADDGQAVESVVLACQDVSALHELAQEKERFLSVAAHELRTPLTALHATTQLAQIDPTVFDDRARREVVLGRIHRQSERLVRLVEQLLDSVRVQSAALPLARADVDLVALCRDVVEMTMPAGGPRAVIRAEGPAPVVGRWDPLRIEQVVTNLLSNAVRYSTAAGEVTVEVRRQNGSAVLSVSDAGIGIPAHQLDQLFTPFFRGSNAQKSNSGGLGLGLHIAREIVHRHGGSIRVESRENAGTTFTVELPLDS
jgi:signal transduction histidine kinase/GAF domain-containing protein